MDQNHLQFAPRGFDVVKTRNNSPLFQLLIKSRSGSDWEESLNLRGFKTKDLTLQALLLLCCCSFDGTEETCNRSSRYLWSPNMIYQLFSYFCEISHLVHRSVFHAFLPRVQLSNAERCDSSSAICCSRLHLLLQKILPDERIKHPRNLGCTDIKRLFWQLWKIKSLKH